MYHKTEFENDDIRQAMDNHPQSFKFEDIQALIAEAPGHNDEDDWYWLGVLKNGQYFGAIGGCDLTGWDCNSSMTSWIANTPEEAIAGFGNDGEKHQDKVTQVIAQFKEEQPFGLEVNPT